MTSLRRLAALGLVGLVALTLPARGQGRPPQNDPGLSRGPRSLGPGGPPDPALGFAGRILRDLDLSDAQRRQVHGILRSQVDGELRSLIQDLGESRRRLEMLVWNPSVPEADVAAAAETMADASLALDKARRRLAAEVLGALTESQRRTFHEMLAAAKPPMPPGPPPEGDPDSCR